MPTIHDAAAALLVLKNTITATLAAHYTDDFTSYGGVVITKEDDTANPEEQVGLLYLNLTIEDDEESPFSAPAREKRQLTVKGAAGATGYSGGTTGAANAVASNTALMQTLQQMLRDHYDDFESAGLLMPSIKVGRKRHDPSSKGDLSENECRLVVTYRTED